jgi:hypothetical protein
VHLLEPVPAAGLTYEDRDALAARVHDAPSGIAAPRLA